MPAVAHGPSGAPPRRRRSRRRAARRLQAGAGAPADRQAHDLRQPFAARDAHEPAGRRSSRRRSTLRLGSTRDRRGRRSQSLTQLLGSGRPPTPVRTSKRPSRSGLAKGEQLAHGAAQLPSVGRSRFASDGGLSAPRTAADDSRGREDAASKSATATVDLGIAEAARSSSASTSKAKGLTSRVDLRSCGDGSIKLASCPTAEGKVEGHGQSELEASFKVSEGAKLVMAQGLQDQRRNDHQSADRRRRQARLLRHQARLRAHRILRRLQNSIRTDHRRLRPTSAKRTSTCALGEQHAAAGRRRRDAHDGGRRPGRTDRGRDRSRPQGAGARPTRSSPPRSRRRPPSSAPRNRIWLTAERMRDGRTSNRHLRKR